MSTEWIREIIVQHGQVLLNSKSSNDDLPFHTWRCDILSAVFQREGQPGLDREIMRMLCEYAVLVGRHKSIARYCLVKDSEEAAQFHQQYTAALNAVYDLLPDDDKKHPLTAQSEAAKQYRAAERRLLDEKYTALAALCAAFGGYG